MWPSKLRGRARCHKMANTHAIRWVMQLSYQAEMLDEEQLFAAATDPQLFAACYDRHESATARLYGAASTGMHGHMTCMTTAYKSVLSSGAHVLQAPLQAARLCLKGH